MHIKCTSHVQEFFLFGVQNGLLAFMYLIYTFLYFMCVHALICTSSTNSWQDHVDTL